MPPVISGAMHCHSSGGIVLSREVAKAGLSAVIDEISCLCHLEDALNKKRYDLAVIDYFLPDGTGEQAIDVLLNHEINKSVKILLVSGNPWINEGSMKERGKTFYFLQKDKLGYGEILRDITESDGKDRIHSNGILIRSKSAGGVSLRSSPSQNGIPTASFPHSAAVSKSRPKS